MTEIKKVLESLGHDVDEETIAAIETQLREDKELASQASAVHIDI